MWQKQNTYHTNRHMKHTLQEHASMHTPKNKYKLLAINFLSVVNLNFGLGLCVCSGHGGFGGEWLGFSSIVVIV